MPALEFLRWQIYERIQPFGDRLQAILMGMQLAAMFNLKRSKDTDRVWKIADFVGGLIEEETEPEKQENAALTEEQKALAMHAMAVVHNARERRKMGLPRIVRDRTSTGPQ